MILHQQKVYIYIYNNIKVISLKQPDEVMNFIYLSIYLLYPQVHILSYDIDLM